MKAVYIALGSNIGECGNHLIDAFQCLQSVGTLVRSSFVYENSPMYHVDQGLFYNAVCFMHTLLDPISLLKQLKSIESELGRTATFRNGPRVIDLDILFYDNEIINTADLITPHSRIQERRFVLQPLVDINPDFQHPVLLKSVAELLQQLPPLTSTEVFRRVIPCYNHCTQRTKYLPMVGKYPLLMGIVNVTPDSFSDGGQHNESITTTLQHIDSLLQDGADMIDIGGESTRPQAETVATDEEIQRVIPVIKALREKGCSCVISVDTRKAMVAEAAILAGADIINDISGGLYDGTAMFEVVRCYRVPYIAMHIRGDPTTMTSSEHTTYHNLLQETTQELNNQLHLLDTYLPRWLQLIDPGLGFAKTASCNQHLLHPTTLLAWKAALGHRPLLIGISRKRSLPQWYEQYQAEKDNILLQSTSNHQKETVVFSNEEKDLLTAGACCAAVLGGANILRVHNIREVKLVLDTFLSCLFHAPYSP